MTPVVLLAVLAVCMPGVDANYWLRRYGGELTVSGADLLRAEDGGYFVLGTVHYDDERSSIYLLRIDKSGEQQWHALYGTDLRAQAASMLLEEGKGLLLAGTTAGDGEGGLDAYLLRLSEDGSEVWSQTYGGALDEMAVAILPAAEGGYALLANLVDPDDFVAHADEAGYGGLEGRSSLHIIRLDPDGNELWSRTYDAGENVLAASGLETSDGGFLVLGTIMYYPRRDDNDMVLLRVGASGDVVWRRTWGADRATAYDIIETTDGNYLIGGSTAPIGAGASVVDALLISVDIDGNERWQTTLGDPEEIDFAAQLAEMPEDGFLSVGGAADIPVLAVDPDGVELWQHTLPIGCHTLFGELTPHPDGGYVAVGSVVCFPEFDVFVARLDANGKIPPDQAQR
jgi:outer membrane protein assembly factor BamB